MATARKADRFAGAWKEVIDPETGFARGRGPDGMWRTPFDPLENAQAGEFHGDYTEANAWIYTWHVFQDPCGLAERLGGRDKALAKLDEFFATAPVRAEKAEGNNDLGGVAGDGQIGQYWHGNEPSHHIAYLYAVWGRPEKTEALVGKICAEAYRSTDGGLCGNDDCGQMSAWYVFSMLGLYPFNPCDGGYVLGAPQVPRGSLALPGGRRLIVDAEGFGGGTISEADGIYHNPETGDVDIEKSFRIEIFTDDENAVNNFAQELCRVFNQHSVYKQREITDTKEIVRK
jgi:predicted alpha-1,2-mannosidase